MGKMRVIGSFSSSEEELVTTPEYTSCDEPDSECLHANCYMWLYANCHINEAKGLNAK